MISTVQKSPKDEDLDLLEFISPSKTLSKLKQQKTIIKKDLITKDMDSPKVTENSCRFSDISANEYLRHKKGIQELDEENSLKYDDSFEDESPFEKTSAAKCETPWIPLPKSLDVEVTDWIKPTNSANFLKFKQKNSETDLKLQNKAKKSSFKDPKNFSESSLKTSQGLTKNSVFSDTKGKTKKSQQALETENKALREKLLKLSNQLSLFLENSKFDSPGLKPKKKPFNSFESSTRSHSDVNIEKRLKIYESEFLKVKSRYEKVNNPEYLKHLTQEIAKKDKLLAELDKKLKNIGRSQINREKKIEGFDSSQGLEDRNSFSSLTEELFKYQTSIKTLELQIEKQSELNQLNQAKEEKLLQKLSKFKPNSENSKILTNDFEEKYEKLKRKLENLEKIRNSSLKQLKNLEYSTRCQKEENFKEFSDFEEKFKQKVESLKIIRSELETLANKAASLNLNLFDSAAKLRSKSETKPLGRSIRLESINDASKSKINKSSFELSPNSNRNLAKARSEVKFRFKGQILVEKFLKNSKNNSKSIKKSLNQKIPTDGNDFSKNLAHESKVKKKLILSEKFEDLKHVDQSLTESSSKNLKQGIVLNLNPLFKQKDLKSSKNHEKGDNFEGNHNKRANTENDSKSEKASEEQPKTQKPQGYNPDLPADQIFQRKVSPSNEGNLNSDINTGNKDKVEASEKVQQKTQNKQIFPKIREKSSISADENDIFKLSSSSDSENNLKKLDKNLYANFPDENEKIFSESNSKSLKPSKKKTNPTLSDQPDLHSLQKIKKSSSKLKNSLKSQKSSSNSRSSSSRSKNSSSKSEKSLKN